LRRVAQASGPAPRALAILAPADDATDLSVLVEQLRQQGEIVVQLFPGETAQHDEFVFDRELAFDGQQWVMRAV